MSALAYLRANRGRVAVGCGAGLLLLCGAGALGSWLHPRTVTVTEYRDRVQTVEHTVTVEKPVVQYRDRVVTKTIYRTGPVAEVVKTEDKSGKTTGGKETTTDARKIEDKSGSTSVTVSPEGRWSVRVLAGGDSRGGIVAGGGAEYRLVGPLTAGVWFTVPVAGSAGVAAGVSIGLRL